MSIDKKGSREIKRKPLNRYMIKRETASTNTFTKKLKTNSVDVPIDADHIHIHYNIHFSYLI